jgi:hypothetical protein
MIVVTNGIDLQTFSVVLWSERERALIVAISTLRASR